MAGQDQKKKPLKANGASAGAQKTLQEASGGLRESKQSVTIDGPSAMRPRLKLSAPEKAKKVAKAAAIGSPDLMYGGDMSLSVPDRPSQVDTGDNRRSTRRRSVLWPAKLIVGKHEFACQIWNLSLGGARIRVDLPLKDGTAVSLKAPTRDPLDAFVVWCEGDSLGLQFVDDPETVRDHFLDRLHVLGLE